MADEITISVSLAYEDAEMDEAIQLAFANLIASVSTKRYVRHKASVATSEQAMELGGLATLGWCLFYNADPTNYVEIRSATGAANDIIKVPPRKPALFHFGSDVSAPFLIANTSACLVEYLLISQ